MKSILIGNGFNVNLGGLDYTNKAIISRFIENAKSKDYATTLFANKITNEENALILPGLFNELKSILNDKYNAYCSTDEDKALISLLKDRYTLSSEIEEIGMEDYFIILRLFHLRYNDTEEMIKNTHDGFCMQFLDAIYNNGRIQNIGDEIEESEKVFLREKINTYNEVYTVNYDKNIEVIASCEVKHLHGDFETLLDQYDETTPLGVYFKKQNSPNPVTNDNAHIYSNCIMGFSGNYKEHIIDIMDNGQLGSYSILLKYTCGMVSDEQLSILKNSEDKGQKMAYGLISAVIENPNLKMHTYPMKEFRNISDEIHLLGISPSNDEHIWSTILKNKNISKIVFFYNSERSKEMIEKMFNDSRIECLPKEEFWNK